MRAIAAELGVTDRTVRNRLRRAGNPLPSERKAVGIDLEALFADYRAGVPMGTLAPRLRRRRNVDQATGRRAWRRVRRAAQTEVACAAVRTARRSTLAARAHG